MRPVLLMINPAEDCVMHIFGEYVGLTRGVPAFFPVPGECEIFFSLWGGAGSGSRILVPSLERVVLEGGGIRSSTCPALDWGDVMEVFPDPMRELRIPGAEPKSFGAVDIDSNGRRVRAELFRDTCMRIAFSGSTGEDYTVALGEGEAGSISVIDVGSRRLLCVVLSREEGERMIVLTASGEITGEISGFRTYMKSGEAHRIIKLPSVRGFERRTVFELRDGAFREKNEEIGFFTGEEHVPGNESETAVSFIEELDLGLDDWKERLCPDLREELDAAALKDFFGSHARAVPYPVEEPDGTATVGLTGSGGGVMKPERFVFGFDEGMIFDITETGR
ncbi:MAG: hypothetical protein IKG85_04740 [Clostridia bacterium]|nr:hypothetical protein [Clostridia bacterium]